MDQDKVRGCLMEMYLRVLGDSDFDIVTFSF